MFAGGKKKKKKKKRDEAREGNTQDCARTNKTKGAEEDHVGTGTVGQEDNAARPRPTDPGACAKGWSSLGLPDSIS